MTGAQAKSEIFWTAFKSLTKKDRAVVMGRFLSEREFLEDLADIGTIERRRHEGTVSLEEHLGKRNQKR
jgi:hypothetical protein